MVLRLPARVSTPATIKPGLATPKRNYDTAMPDVGQKATKAVSIRLSETHIQYLEECQKVYDCDRSEAMRRAIRLLRLAANGHNANLVTQDRSGKEQKYPIMTDGIPI